MPELRVRRDDPATCRLFEDTPADGEAVLQVERFALTANNVTYAVLGDRLRYWDVFPAPEGWGRVPAWGDARVVASRSPALPEGARVTGLVPMGTRFAIDPEASRLGFTDRSPHRAELAPFYNQYVPIEGEGEDAELVLRPLFMTAMLLDLALDDTETVVLTSASSKTALGLAHLLRRRGVRTVGLTSPERTAWVEDLGLHDVVAPYDRIPDEGPAILVDFTGDRRIVRAVHERLPLHRSVLVGFTHHDASRQDTPIPGPKPQFFFAPTEPPERRVEVWRRYADAWRDFAPVVERTMRIERVGDGDGLERVWRALVQGRADPGALYVVSP
jgi:uncharacterized protein DUF2855